MVARLAAPGPYRIAEERRPNATGSLWRSIVTRRTGASRPNPSVVGRALESLCAGALSAVDLEHDPKSLNQRGIFVDEVL